MVWDDNFKSFMLIVFFGFLFLLGFIIYWLFNLFNKKEIKAKNCDCDCHNEFMACDKCLRDDY